MKRSRFSEDFSKLEVRLLSGKPEGAQGEAMKWSRFSEDGMDAS
jgi:hypothetical protein